MGASWCIPPLSLQLFHLGRRKPNHVSRSPPPYSLGSLHLELTKEWFLCPKTTDWKGSGHLQVVCPQRWVGVSMVPDHSASITLRGAGPREGTWEVLVLHQTSAVDAFDCLSSGQTPCPQPTTP